MVVTNEWRLCAASVPVGRGRWADGLFIVFLRFSGVRRRRRTELVDLLPLGRSLLFKCSELRILGHAQRIIN